MKKRKSNLIGPLVPQFNYGQVKPTFYIGPTLLKIIRVSIIVAAFIGAALYFL